MRKISPLAGQELVARRLRVLGGVAGLVILGVGER